MNQLKFFSGNKKSRFIFQLKLENTYSEILDINYTSYNPYKVSNVWYCQNFTSHAVIVGYKITSYLMVTHELEIIFGFGEMHLSWGRLVITSLWK